MITGPPLSKTTWIAAACCVALIHAGLVFTLIVQTRKVDSTPELGAQAIDISLDIEAPRTEPTDLPAGPDAAESAAASPQIQQTAVAPQTQAPEGIPTETPDPDQVVAPKQIDTPQPPTAVAAAPTVASSAAIASEATAPAPLPSATPSIRSAAPASGTGESAQRLRSTWQRELVAHLEHFKRYPDGTASHSATLVIAFTIDRSGHVLNAVITRSSGTPAFDMAALAMVHRADPVPPPPPLVADDGLSYTIPVIFRGRGRS